MDAPRVLIIAPESKGLPILRYFVRRGWEGKPCTYGFNTLEQSNIYGAGPDLIVLDLRVVSPRDLLHDRVIAGWEVPRLGILPAKTPDKVIAAYRRCELHSFVFRPLTDTKIDQALESLGWPPEKRV